MIHNIKFITVTFWRIQFSDIKYVHRVVWASSISRILSSQTYTLPLQNTHSSSFLKPPSLLSVLVNLMTLGPQISGITYHFPFFDGLITLSIKVHPHSLCHNSFLFMAVLYSTVWMGHAVLIQSSFEGCLGRFFLILWLFLSLTIPTACGSSWARNSIWAAAVGLHHSCSNTRSLTHCARWGIEPEHLLWPEMLQLGY